MRVIAGLALALVLGAALPVRAATIQLVPGARLAAVAERAVHALPADPDHALTPAFTLTDQELPAGTLSINAGTPLVNPTYVSVPIAVAVDGRVARTVVAGFRVTSFVHTAVAARDLPAGAVLGTEDLVVGRVPANGRAAVSAQELVGRKVRVLTARGAVIYPEQTAPNELVHAGENVTLVVRDGVVALTADVLARSNGALGDHVSVYNPQTQKALTGTVTGPGRVELVLAGAE